MEEIPLKKIRDNDNKKYAGLITQNYEYPITEGYDFIKIYSALIFLLRE